MWLASTFSAAINMLPAFMRTWFQNATDCCKCCCKWCRKCCECKKKKKTSKSKKSTRKIRYEYSSSVVSPFKDDVRGINQRLGNQSLNQDLVEEVNSHQGEANIQQFEQTVTNAYPSLNMNVFPRQL